MSSTPSSPLSISVIITNYNYADLIEETLLSLRDQEHSINEIIIVDDASSDNSAALITKLSENDRRVQPVLLEQNVGQLGAFNAGVAAATGDIISFIDADDTWVPSYTAEVLSVFTNEPECSYLFTGYRLFGNTEGDGLCKPLGALINHGPTQLLTSMDASTWLSGPTSCISISASLAMDIFPIPLEKEWRTCADNALQIAAALAGAEKYNLAKPLMNYRSHDSNLFLGQKPSEKKQLAIQLSRAKTATWYQNKHNHFFKDLSSVATSNSRGQLKLAQLITLEAEVGTKSKDLQKSYHKTAEAFLDIPKRRKKELLNRISSITTA